MWSFCSNNISQLIKTSVFSYSFCLNPICGVTFKSFCLAQLPTKWILTMLSSFHFLFNVCALLTIVCVCVMIDIVAWRPTCYVGNSDNNISGWSWSNVSCCWITQGIGRILQTTIRAISDQQKRNCHFKVLSFSLRLTCPPLFIAGGTLTHLELNSLSWFSFSFVLTVDCYRVRMFWLIRITNCLFWTKSHSPQTKPCNNSPGAPVRRGLTLTRQ